MEEYLNDVQKMTFSSEKVRPLSVPKIFSLQKKHFYLVKDKNAEMSFETRNSLIQGENTPKKKSVLFSPIKKCV